MVLLKGKTIARQSKAIEGRGTSKNVATSKFKIYSENPKVDGPCCDNADANSSTSLLSKKGALLTSISRTKTKAYLSGAEEMKGSHNSLDKTKVGRKALADVSNVRGSSSIIVKPGGSSLFRNSMTSSTRNSTASSSWPLSGKAKTNLTHGAMGSQNSVKTNTKTTRTSSNFHRVKVNENVENMTRRTSKSNNTITRKSFPVLKKASQLGASGSQGDIRSGEKSTKKVGFPVKTRVGGKVVPQTSNLKGKVTKHRASDAFILKPPRDQTDKHAAQGLRKSAKPVARTTLQTSSSQKDFKSKGVYRLDKSLSTTSARRVKLATSSICKTFKSTDSHEEASKEGVPAERSDYMKPQISEIMMGKKSGRRKSYTSSLISRSKENVPNIDDVGNPLEVAEYVDDIYQYYWIMEAQSASLENYMMIQTDITPQMRAILINWLIEVHYKFDLMPETLYLTIALLDRYLYLVSIKKKDLQLVGLTSLLLASKYEDFWHPRVKDLISISADSYTREQMLEMEKSILKKLRFRLNLPTAYVFMLRFLKASQSDKQLEHLAFYLIELCLVEYEALRFRPSLLCASAVYVARCTLNKVPAWTSLLGKHARYEEIQIRDCAEMILRVHKAASSGLLQVTYDKYKWPEFGGVTGVKPLDNLPL